MKRPAKEGNKLEKNRGEAENHKGEVGERRNVREDGDEMEGVVVSWTR